MTNFSKNQIMTVRIDGYSSEALGVCHVEGRAVFVAGAIPGELWEISLTRVTASVVYARGLKLLEPSPEREAPLCPYFGRCGGCDCRHLSYGEELRFKLGRVNDALRRIGKQSVQAAEIIGSDSVARYRNKGIFAVAKQDGKAVAGFYRSRSHQLIAVESCLIQNELSESAAAAVTGFMNSHGIEPYDELSCEGTVRHVFCRKAVRTGDAVVCVSSAGGLGGDTAALVDALRSACPELTGIVLNINKSRGNTILSGEFYTLWGKSEVSDSLCGLSFDIAPQAFFQINPPQAEKLYRKALEYAALDGGELALDLYCGAGTISLCLARGAKRVIGAELVPEAIENARLNARRNGIENAEFICGDAGDAAAELFRRGLRPRVIVVDPPRKGMLEEAVRAAASMEPERIVYLSCDPATLARDILRFQSSGYELREVTAVDMFPRTCHVETVALMTKKS